MRAERFWISVVLFHGILIWVSVRIGLRWVARMARPQPALPWIVELTRDALTFGLTAGLAGVLASFAPWPAFTLMRLWCQALFGEAMLLSAFVGWLHARRRLHMRASLAAATTLLLLAVYAEAYHREPHDLQVRHHLADLSGGDPHAATLRILHLTDIQTPEIGAYEEQAIRRGLAEQPELIVFTGDYIHERLEPTGPKAAADLLAMLQRVGFAAPLGVYATEGDTCCDCRNTFAGLPVACLVNESIRLPLPGERSLSIVGLAGRTSR